MTRSARAALPVSPPGHVSVTRTRAETVPEKCSRDLGTRSESARNPDHGHTRALWTRSTSSRASPANSTTALATAALAHSELRIVTLATVGTAPF